MISLRLAVSAVLVATLLAGVFAYSVVPLPQVEVDQRLLSAAPDPKDHPDQAKPTNFDRVQVRKNRQLKPSIEPPRRS
jgi:hypothetical protein